MKTMTEGRARRTGGLAAILLLAGCGAGTDGAGPGGGTDASTGEVSSEPNAESRSEVVGETGASLGAANANPRLRIGTFVDSAVGGLMYETESRTGTTDEQGRFEYLAGESVTFSIGGLIFPTVKAAERLTPVDLGRETRNAERFAINAARLLQTLDADGLPDNGIEIQAEVAAAVGPIDLDVESATFEQDPALISLLEGTDGRLVRADAATEHLARTLSVASAPGVTTDLAGLWEVSPVGNAGSLRYASLSPDGELSFYRSGFDPGLQAPAGCFDVEHHTLASLGDGAYFAVDAAGQGDLFHMTIVRASSDELVLEQRGSLFEPDWQYSMVSVPDRVRAEFVTCTGQSFQSPPATLDTAANLDGLWVVDEVEDPDGNDRPISHVLLDEYGYGVLFFREREFGPAPVFELVECYAPAGELHLSDTHSGVADGASVEGIAWIEEQVFETYGDVVHEYVGYTDLAATARREGEALTLDVEGESTRRLTRADGDVDSLPACEHGDRSPLTVVQGLWRERGAGLFGDYLHIDVDGNVRGVAPASDGRDCYLDVPATSLSPLGGMDFRSVGEDGTARALRLVTAGATLTVEETAADGSNVPVRWLEKAPGLVLDDFERCDFRPEKVKFPELEPFAGRWMSVGIEGTYTSPLTGEEIPHREYHVAELASEGILHWRRASIGGFYSLRKDELCAEEEGAYESAIEVIGDGLFRIDNKIVTLSREQDTLTITGLYAQPWVRHATDIDVPALPSCATGLTPTDPLLGPLDGVWLIEAPTETDPSFTLLRFDSERRGGEGHFIHRFDASADCQFGKALVAESVDGERVVLSHRDEGGNAVGVFTIVDGELDVTLRSGSDELRGVRDGRFPRVSGLDVERLSPDGRTGELVPSCTP